MPADLAPPADELLPAACDLAARLSADGRRLTRDALLAGLRGRGHVLSTPRVCALLADLRTTLPVPNGARPDRGARTAVRPPATA